MRSRFLNILILVVFVVGVVGASELAWLEITLHDVCPKLVGIPACYIILICMIVPLIAQVLHLKNRVYFIFTGFAFIIALLASIMQLTGNGMCPKSVGGTPLCYYSLVLFSTLLLLKIAHLNDVSKNL